MTNLQQNTQTRARTQTRTHTQAMLEQPWPLCFCKFLGKPFQKVKKRGKQRNAEFLLPVISVAGELSLRKWKQASLWERPGDYFPLITWHRHHVYPGTPALEDTDPSVVCCLVCWQCIKRSVDEPPCGWASLHSLIMSYWTNVSHVKIVWRGVHKVSWTNKGFLLRWVMEPCACREQAPQQLTV